MLCAQRSNEGRKEYATGVSHLQQTVFVSESFELGTITAIIWDADVIIDLLQNGVIS